METISLMSRIFQVVEAPSTPALLFEALSQPVQIVNRASTTSLSMRLTSIIDTEES